MSEHTDRPVRNVHYEGRDLRERLTTCVEMWQSTGPRQQSTSDLLTDLISVLGEYDDRPPSDTGTTGWHQWAALPQYVHRADDQTTTHGDCRPVLVVDPAEAQKVIAHIIQMARIGAGSGELADQILAALANQEGTS